MNKAPMKNLAMEHKLFEGELIDLSKNERDGEFYVLTPKQADQAENGNFDFANCDTEEWIWSIGRTIQGDPKAYAAHTAHFYQNPSFKCIWLR